MTPGIPHGARLRGYLAGVVVTVGLCGVAWRAWALQVGEGDRYRAIAARQQEQSVAIPAPRGDIIDAHGRPLAVSAATDSVWANPREIRDVTDTADQLAQLLGGDAVTLEAKLAGAHRFVWLARHVAPEVARAVASARLPGIEVSKEPRRWYPMRTVGGTVIGRSDIDGNGLDGIELALNAQLIGHRGAGVALRDARGKRMFADGIERPEAGATVQLSIDASIQATAEAAVDDAVRTNKARSGVVVVLEVGTGRVIAMASAPARDPNGTENQGSARNRAVVDSYEAGSVMKVFSVAAALDDGVVTPETEFEIGGGVLKLPGRAVPIRDVEHDLYLDVAGIIKRSSNVGAAKIALRFGATKLYAAFKRFGFGKRTGIELPGEQPGMLRDGAKWRDVELATIAFGYGLTVTPLQLAAALAAFGDHGVYHEPRIVDRVIDADGTLLYQATPASRQVVSDRTATQMKAMLASVFEGGKQHGTASTLVVPGFRCGGKTGTANKYDPAIRTYALDHYLSTFAGLAPIDQPRLAIAVVIDDPSDGDHFGAKVAGPVFARIASEALRYLGVPGEPATCPPPVPGAAPSSAVRTCVPATASDRARSSGAAPSDPRSPAGASPAPGDPRALTGAPRAAPGDHVGAPPAAPNDPRALTGGPPAAPNDPRALATASLAASNDPRALATASAAAPNDPRVLSGVPPAASGDPRALAGAPRAAPGDPRALASPSGAAPNDPRVLSGVPRAASGDPRALAVIIPDFRGMGMARAIAAAREARVQIELSGSGRVTRQDPPPGPYPPRTTFAGASPPPLAAAGPAATARDRTAAAPSPRVMLQFSDGNPPRPRSPGDSP
jgi:cell division protein FtsI (penicillin-binding protein 3)